MAARSVSQMPKGVKTRPGKQKAGAGSDPGSNAVPKVGVEPTRGDTPGDFEALRARQGDVAVVSVLQFVHQKAGVERSRHHHIRVAQ